VATIARPGLLVPNWRQELMKRSILAASVLALGIVAAFAQNDPIAARKALMKKMGTASGEMTKVMKGEAPFDLALVQANLKVFAESAKQASSLFPDTSKAGDTAALPKVWETKADFDAKFAKLADDATAAAAKIKDEASFKTVYPDVAKDCGGCHQDYRARKS
jgi:cytochrome c556